MTTRRSFLTGLGASLIAAPAVVRAVSLMPVRGIVMPVGWWQDALMHKRIEIEIAYSIMRRNINQALYDDRLVFNCKEYNA